MAPIIAPDKDQMLQHLGLLFGRALSGRVEITAIHTDKAAHNRPQTSFFDIDDLDAAADFAVEVNAKPGWNTYVGAALRKEDVFPGKAADDQDFLRTYALWADADDDKQLETAREAYRALGVTPPFIVITGRTPTKRAQFWWPLDNPIDDIDQLRGALRGIVAGLKTDPAVCTGKQLMRLAGGVNWPKKDDRVLERTEVHVVERAAREFSVEQMARAFPPQSRVELSAAVPDVEIAHAGALGLEERVMDGRETYAFNLVTAHLHEYLGTNGAEPTVDELYKSVAPIFLAKADQIRPGRGPDFLKQKCADRLRAYYAGQIPFMRDLEEAVQSWAARAQRTDAERAFRGSAAYEADASGQGAVTAAPATSSQPFRASELIGDPPERRWIVRDWVVEGAVNSLYGDGGLGKTLLAQQLACAVSIGAPWLGLPTIQGPVLAILCEDEKNELWRRHNEIKAAMGHTIGNPFDDVWLWPRVGEDNVLIRWDRDGKAALGALAQQIVDAVERLSPTLLILDTLADFYGGNEIDRPQVNYFVKTVLGGMIKARAEAGHALSVLLLGHPSVSGSAVGGRGYSGSTAWNNAVRSRMYLTRPEEGASEERILTRGKANYASSGDDTAIRLFYSEGVLHAQTDADDGDSMLWAAKRDVVAAVDKAWREGKPFSGQKAHKRFIHNAIIPEMKRGGFGPEITRQAVRECVDDGEIVIGASNGKRGYRSAKNG